jgi:signal recognition particle subunit SRP54
MFNRLRDSLRAVFSRMSRKGTLTEEDVKRAVREVKLALLEADVNLDVLKKFLEDVKQKAVGAEVLGSLSPTQNFIRILKEELTLLLGGERRDLNLSRVPSKIMVVGLNGAGKTTTAVKLAYYLKSKKGKKPLLVGCDLKRPAAFQQLRRLASSVGFECVGGEGSSLRRVVEESEEYAMRNGYEVLIYDTAGRLHVNEELMEELAELKELVEPQEVLYVADAMTGQDAVNSARAFDEAVGITGVVLTKLDGDTRGGAALSIKYVTGKPIKFAGTGEKVGDLEEFYPDRMASRILGMGDVLSLIEEAEKLVEGEESAELEKKVVKGDFDLNDFLNQLRKIRKMGSLRRMLSLLPGVNVSEEDIDERELVKVEAIISSMTPEERRNPKILNSSRRRRIARGSGTSVEDVNRLVRRFEEAKKMMMAVVKSVSPVKGRSKNRRKKKRRKR